MIEYFAHCKKCFSRSLTKTFFFVVLPWVKMPFWWKLKYLDTLLRSKGKNLLFWFTHLLVHSGAETHLAVCCRVIKVTTVLKNIKQDSIGVAGNQTQHLYLFNTQQVTIKRSWFVTCWILCDFITILNLWFYVNVSALMGIIRVLYVLTELW